MKIVKAEAGFFIKNRRLKPFAFKDRPVITESYRILHNFERMNLITATKKGRTGNISPLSKFKIVSHDKLKKELEECEEQLKSIDFYLLQEVSDYVDQIKDWSEVETEKIVDSQYHKLIRGISNAPLYTHPIISKNINRVGSADFLEDLIVQVKDIKEGKFPPELEADRRMIVRDLIIKWIERGDRYSVIRMTEPANSELKNGECEFVCNYRYLEFLRNKDLNVMVFERHSRKYIVAIGKDCPKEWYPASAELYVFDVTGYDKERIDNFVRELERYATLVVAEKFKIPSNWKHEIFEMASNTWHKCRGCNDEEEFVREIGSFGGEVYFAYSVELREFVHKPMDRTEVLEYLKRLLINLQNDFLRMDDEIEFDLSGCNNLEDFLRSLEKKLQDFRKGESDNEMRFKIPRPVRFGDIRNAGVFDCEIGAYLTLYFLIKYGSKFGVSNLKILYIRKEDIRSILNKHYPKIKNPDKKLLINYYMNCIEDDHIVILVKTERGAKIIDPTDLLYSIYKDFYEIKVMEKDLNPEKIVSQSLKEELCIDVLIPFRVYTDSYKESEKEKNRYLKV